MCASRKWVVGKDHVSLFPIAAECLNLEPDSFLHTTEMHWQMRGVCNKVALRVKQSTGKVKTLFNVCACRCLLQCYTHLFCDRHKAMAKNRKFNWVERNFTFLCRLFKIPLPLHWLQVHFYVSERVNGCFVLGFNQNCTGFVQNYCWTIDLHAGL